MTGAAFASWQAPVRSEPDTKFNQESQGLMERSDLSEPAPDLPHCIAVAFAARTWLGCRRGFCSSASTPSSRRIVRLNMTGALPAVYSSERGRSFEQDTVGTCSQVLRSHLPGSERGTDLPDNWNLQSTSEKRCRSLRPHLFLSKSSQALQRDTVATGPPLPDASLSSVEGEVSGLRLSMHCRQREQTMAIRQVAMEWHNSRECTSYVPQSWTGCVVRCVMCVCGVEGLHHAILAVVISDPKHMRTTA